MTKLTLLNRAIFILSILGVAIATYVLQGWLRQSPLFCLSGSGCEAVAKSVYSYPFGIPVPAVGLLGYSFLAVLAFLRTTSQKLNTKLLHPMLAMAGFGVGFVTWFTYTEIFIIKGICSWCAISAVNMIIIFLMVIISYRLSPRA